MFNTRRGWLTFGEVARIELKILSKINQGGVSDKVSVSDKKFQTNQSEGRYQQKKNVFFRALPESPAPPPWPQFGQLGPLFLRQKQRFVCMIGKKFDADNEGCNDNYDDNYGNFDDNYDKND